MSESAEDIAAMIKDMDTEQAKAICRNALKAIQAKERAQRSAEKRALNDKLFAEKRAKKAALDEQISELQAQIRALREQIRDLGPKVRRNRTKENELKSENRRIAREAKAALKAQIQANSPL